MKRFKKLTCVVAALIGLTIVVIGCRSLENPTHYLPPPEFAGWYNRVTAPAVRRVAILPFENQTRYQRIDSQLGHSFSAGMQMARDWEIVDVNELRQPPCPIENVKRGDYPMQVLVDMYRHYNADAVLFASVDHFHPYDPMSLGVTAYLVDTRESTVVAYASGNWSMSRPEVAEDFLCYVDQRCSAGLDNAVLLRSPAVFGQYVVDRIVGRWLQQSP